MKLTKGFLISVLLTSLNLATSSEQASENRHRSTGYYTSLSSISATNYTSFQHPLFPTHSIKIHKAPQEWCDNTVSKYTGYISTTGARHIFFYFFESRNDPAKDDFIMWINGGPGASASIGLFMELGPCVFREEGEEEPSFNSYSWNEKANVLFIDQPVGMFVSYFPYCIKIDIKSYRCWIQLCGIRRASGDNWGGERRYCRFSRYLLQLFRGIQRKATSHGGRVLRRQ